MPKYGPKIVTDGLVLCLDAASTKSYPGSGTTWYDVSTIKNNGILTNGATISSFGGGSIEFDGVNDYVDLNKAYTGSGEELGIGSFVRYTLEAWIYPRSSQGSSLDADCIIGTTGTGGVGMQLGSSSSRPIMNYGARATNNFSGNLFNYNEWTHVCLSRNSTTSCRSYLNGSFDVSLDTGQLDISTSYSPGEMRIGNASSRVYGYYDGYIAVARIYNTALTDDEVKQNYNATKGRFGL